MRALNKHLLALMLQKVGGMDRDNQSENAQFLLLGMSESPEQQQILFWMFLSTYLVTVVGNALIILAISSDSRLHTPMYFFLANLSFTDLFFVTNTIPKMLVNLQSQNKAISYAGCLTQLYFLVSLVTLENLILAVMVYDRYVAICHPLHYTTAMSPGLCVLLLCLCWGLSVLYGLLLTLLMTRVTFCGSQKIHYLFCKMYVLLRLACSNTHIIHTVLVATGCFIFLTPLGFTTIPQIPSASVSIVRTILQIPSASKKYKTFSTCASHLGVVSLFYGTLAMVYLQPLHTYSMKDSVATVMYAMVTPMMNPFIYSLRNKDMHWALGRLLGRPFQRLK
ncbi:LOW QUALITY PROTEIN: olfactory receptor 1D5-like [Piliocolobus tephrosceles]|uniref:LOW QUALITY PROTEIN: olfactory receptor 1D5-like n=1 Tax=Piliocolobus tephrosceles TaxID=591936 RepID=UPI000E6B057F|nr:LOW QUALITY PROTEIN: olfactory receptor 1D5-like [Piliocolobus tephrosceles]